MLWAAGRDPTIGLTASWSSLVAVLSAPLSVGCLPKSSTRKMIAKPIRINGKVVAQISRRKKVASAANYYLQVGWDLAQIKVHEMRFKRLRASGYVGNCPRR